MILNNLKLVLRLMRGQKSLTAINLFGLSVGMAVCMLIMLWVAEEFKYDRHHEKLGRLYRVICEEHDSETASLSALTPPPLAAALKIDFPEIEAVTRYGGWGRWIVRHEDTIFSEARFECADPDFFKMFSFDFIRGNPDEALKNVYSVVLTEHSARKYFGEEDPMGQTLNINNRFDVRVTGIIRDHPGTSTLEFDLISPFEIVLKELFGGRNDDNWNLNSFNTFVLLRDQSLAQDLNGKLLGYLQKNDREDQDQPLLQPVGAIHLDSSVNHDFSNITDIKYIHLFSTLALFVLLIACVNFMNLTTARSMKRAKEVGVRKVSGAGRTQLIVQFFGEAVLTTLVSFAVAVVIVEALLPVFNEMTRGSLSLDIWRDWQIVSGFAAIAVITGLLSGYYPALLLSSFAPLKVLKGGYRSGTGHLHFRRILVTVQFTLTIGLLIGTFVVFRQLNFMKSTELGMNTEQVMCIRISEAMSEQYSMVKERLRQEPGVMTVSASLALPTDNHNSPGSPWWEGKPEGNNLAINADFVDFNYIEALQIEMVEGRSFSEAIATDADTAYVINQEAARQMGLENPVGTPFGFWGNKGTIIGVMKDFHFQPLRNSINPIALKIFPDWFRVIYVRLKPGNIENAIASMENLWERIQPQVPFEYFFLEESFEALYQAEERMSLIFQHFTILAIGIACLGLFGLAAFAAEQRTKEIGIRKVLGASVINFALLLSREFVRWVLLANLIAWPLAYLALENWLDNYAYRIGLGIDVFLFAALVALFIALATVSYQSIRAAMGNPITALQQE